HSQVSVVGGAQLNGQTELWDTISNKQVQPVKVTSPGDPLASIAAPMSGTVVSKSPASFDMNNTPAVVTGTGVTVYNTSSAGWGCSSSYSYTPVTISGQVTATLSAPTSGRS